MTARGYPKLPAKITKIKVKHQPAPVRYLREERMGNAVSYFSRTDWTADELREKASSLSIRLLGLARVLQSKHGVGILTPTLAEQLTQLGNSFLPKTFEGYKPRRLNRKEHHGAE